MADDRKRKAPSSSSNNGSQKKQKKQWQHPPKKQNKSQKYASQISTTIEPGDVGVFVTCNRHQEAKLVREIKRLFEEYAQKLYNTDSQQTTASSSNKKSNKPPKDATAAGEEPEDAAKHDDSDEDANDIEAEISAEVSDMRKPSYNRVFENVRLSIECVCFIKIRPPVDPADLVNKICLDLLETGKKKTRFAMRLTPMSAIGKASENGLVEAAKKALRPVFWGTESQAKPGQGDTVAEGGESAERKDGQKQNAEDGAPHEGEKEQAAQTQSAEDTASAEETNVKPVKYAIRPTIRNSNKLSRTFVIERVAQLVGSGHKVDLTNPEKVIVVEVLNNICGITVVPGPDYHRLKRYNLEEIYKITQTENENENEKEAK